MILAYALDKARLSRLTSEGSQPPPNLTLMAQLTAGEVDCDLPPRAALATAIWIDLYQPTEAEVATVESLGPMVPTLEDMEEIEISSRLYRKGDTDYMTVVLPGMSPAKVPMSGPVTFILSPERLVTVRHHAPRPFETYPARADKVVPGCERPYRIFLSLMDEITGRLADILEGIGRALDEIAATVFRPDPTKSARQGEADMLRHALQHSGQQGDLLGRVRLALLTMERAISFFDLAQSDRSDPAVKQVIKTLRSDVQALEVHSDFLSNRLALTTDATLGMINLAQNATVRILSVVAALFLPPTLIASVYGMNFSNMPELHSAWGYPLALGLMLLSAIGTYLMLKWKRWM